MGVPRFPVTCLIVLLTARAAAAQDLSPALAERFSQGTAALKAGSLDAAEAAFRDVLGSGGERAFVHHNLGLVLRERGRDADALGEFRTAIKLDPSFGPAHLLAGTSLLTLGRAGEARTALERAVRLMPREIAAHLQLAGACQRLDDRACVADAYRDIVQLAPDDSEYVYRLGSAYLSLSTWTHERLTKIAPGSARVEQALGREYLRQGQTDRALEALQRAADADPTLPDLHLALARIHLEAGRRDEASREIARELALVPFSKEALQVKDQIGAAATAHDPVRMSEPILPPASAALPSSNRPDIDAAIRAKNWERAETLLASEIERQPAGSPGAGGRGTRDLLVLIARVFFLDGKPLNTAVALKKADAIAPLERDLRFMLVLAYVRLGRADWARPELEKLVASDPNSAEYRYWLGRMDYDAGHYAAAIEHFNEALARDATFTRAHDNLGLCYEALNDDDQAVAHYREAIRLNREARTKSPWPPTNLGILLAQRGALEEAGALLREAIGYDDNFPNAHYQLGKLLEQQGQNDQAIAALRRAAALDPAYPEPHYVLARIYRRLGRAAEADEALATFQRLRAARDQPQR
jgi:tetratricopeptide (TPR) repeat protein